MTFSENKTQKGETDSIIDTHSVTPTNQSNEAGKVESQDSQLKAMLERDELNANSKFGNAIQQQAKKARHLSDVPGQTRSAAVSTEYQYHTDRILFAVLIGLLVVSLIGWAAYMLMQPSQSVDEVSAPLYEPVQATGDPEEAQGIQVSDSVPASPAKVSAAPVAEAVSSEVNSQIEPTADQSLADRLEVASAAPLASEASSQRAPTQASAPPKPMAAPEKPVFDLAEQEATEPAQPTLSAQGLEAAANQVGGDVILEPLFVARAHLAEGVEDLEPFGIYENFELSLEGRNSFRAYWFTHLTGLDGQTVSHRWYYQDELVAQINISIGSTSWRATSNKRVAADSLGQWRVEAVNNDGTVLARQAFTVVK